MGLKLTITRVTQSKSNTYFRHFVSFKVKSLTIEARMST